MRNWLIGIGLASLALAVFGWWALIDGAGPARADGVFDLGAYRALVANDAPETLPREVRVEFVGESEAPSFAAEAGAFDGQRRFTYTAFQIVAPSGATIVDAAVDAGTLSGMTDGAGRFDEAAYLRLVDAMAQAAHLLVTHEHLDHIIAIARHPAPERIAPRLRLTRIQLDALPEHAPNQTLAPEIAAAPSLALDAPIRIAPGIVAAAAPGHSYGTIVIYAKTDAREYLFIGDIAWQMSSVAHVRGRPRAIRWIVPGVDPDRQAVLRQLRALHDLAVAEPNLTLVPAHDAGYLDDLVESGLLIEGFSRPQGSVAPAGP